MKKKVVVISAIVTFAALMLASCGTPPCPEIGSKAPDFTLTTVYGRSLSLSDFQGSPILVNFWSTRCAPCVIEMPIIQEVYDKRSNQGLVVFAINISDSAMATKNFITSRGFTFISMVDPGMKVFQKYCLPQAIPVTLFVDGEGTLKAVKLGAFQHPNQIEDILDSL